MYQVLYRKWRPKKFEDVVGQPQVTATLKNELKSGRINHAYLFTGSRGTGKTTCSKILAKAVNCLDPRDGDPCGECEVCRGIDDGSILDIVEMDAASNRGIDDIREVIDEAQFRPTRCKYRVYIIDEVHMLTEQAFNALLKTLEEPPEHVIFILATTEVHKLPATILSRCQRFDFNRIAPEHIMARLKYVAENENAEISDDAALLIAAIADGAMRDALSLMDRCIGMSSKIDTEVVRNAAGLARKDYLFELAAACINKNTAKALGLVSKLHNESKDMARLCDELIDHFRSLMMIKSTQNAHNLLIMSADEFDEAQTQADYLSLAEIVYIMDILQNTYNRMGKGNSNRTELEMALVKLSAPEIEGTNEALAARVSALEKALKSGSVKISAETPKSESKKEHEIKHEKQEIKPTQTDVPTAPPQMEEIPKSEPEKAPEKEPEPITSEPVATAPMSLEEIYNNAVPFRQWPEVVENIKKYSRGIAAAFDDTNAYVSGNYLLIDAQTEIPFRLMREGSQRENIRKAILEITGKVYKLGPYRKPVKKEEETDPLKKLIEEAKASGIKVTEEKEKLK